MRVKGANTSTVLGTVTARGHKGNHKDRRQWQQQEQQWWVTRSLHMEHKGAAQRTDALVTEGRSLILQMPFPEADRGAVSFPLSLLDLSRIDTPSAGSSQS